MEFRLTYEGPLRHGAKPDEKHAIRKRFHRQLARLWEVHPYLRHYAMFNSPPGMRELVAQKYIDPPYRFLPLARARNHALVALDVLFLRTGEPGQLMKSADLDNRIKALVDSLRMPTGPSEWGKHMPEAGEDPFCCLLEDDKLVSALSVTTDTLLDPTIHATNGHHDTHDCRVVISVNLGTYYDGDFAWDGGNP
jgi:hypothetical protein